jgi:hypothetical protein
VAAAGIVVAAPRVLSRTTGAGCALADGFVTDALEAVVETGAELKLDEAAGVAEFCATG